MWKRFNDDAKKCLVAATLVAVKLGSAEVEVGHLVLVILEHLATHPDEYGQDDVLYSNILKVYAAVKGWHKQTFPGSKKADQKAISKSGEACFSPAMKAILRKLLLGPDQLTCFNLLGNSVISLLNTSLPDGVAPDELNSDGWVVAKMKEKCEQSVLEQFVHSFAGCVGVKCASVGSDTPEEKAARAERVRQHRERVTERTATRRPQRRTILDELGADLVAQAREGKLDPVVGRDAVIEEVIVKLLKYKKNNPLLIGEPGVGKTAVVHGVAQRIAAGNVPEEMREVRIMSLDLGKLTAGTRYRGDFEERMKEALRVVSEAQGKIILFIDEIHTIIGAGSGEGTLDVANMLKPVLTDTSFRCIGATTEAEYSKRFEKDQALDRRFLRVMVPEPNESLAVQMLEGLRQRYSDFHHVQISTDIIKTAVRLSARYISDRKLPDKAIDLLDEAAGRARLDLSQGKLKLPKVSKREEKPRELELTRENVANVISLRTGIPVNKLTESDQKRLLNVESILHKRVVGQDEPIRLVSEAIWRARAGNRDSRRPIGAFLFLGPTGVGKTELAKALAEYLFYDEKALVRLDMSEYSERYSVSRLLGASPGYVGYEEGGQLDVIRHRPHSVVLLDEVEKAHPDIFGSLLQVMDEGMLTDSQGRSIDFKHTLIVMTSNLGFGEVEEKSFGLRVNRNNEDTAVRYKLMSAKVMEATKEFFKPEFLNRLDATVVFHSLEKEHLLQIVDIMIGQLNSELIGEGRSLTFTKAAKERVVDSCHEPQFGARPLRRALRDLVETPMARDIIAGVFPENSRMRVDIDRKHEDMLRFSLVKPRVSKTAVVG